MLVSIVTHFDAVLRTYKTKLAVWLVSATRLVRTLLYLCLFVWPAALMAAAPSKRHSFRRKQCPKAQQFKHHKAEPCRPCQPFARKLAWVTEKIIRLKVLSPHCGVRTLALMFNRAHHPNMSVSKSHVADVLRKHCYRVANMRRKMRHRQP